MTKAANPSHTGSAAARSSAAAEGGGAATAVPWRSRAEADVVVLRSRDCRQGLAIELGDVLGFQHVRERRLSDLGSVVGVLVVDAGRKLGFRSEVFRRGCGDDDVAAAGERGDHSLGRRGESLPALTHNGSG